MATHENFARDEKIKGSSDRGFGLVFAVVFALVAVWPYLHGNPVRWWSLIVAAAFLIAALARPRTLAPLNRVWTRFGLLLHKITNPVIMGLVFYGAVTPTAWAVRAMGKDPLRRKIDRAAASYWILREPPGPTPQSIKHQF
jgi:predicted membrane metal-binding protein